MNQLIILQVSRPNYSNQNLRKIANCCTGLTVDKMVASKALGLGTNSTNLCNSINQCSFRLPNYSRIASYWHFNRSRVVLNLAPDYCHFANQY